MTIIKVGTGLAALCTGLVMAGAAWAAGTYPDHKIRMIVPFGAGGPTDVIGRLVAERAIAAGVSKVVFDRGGSRYHGRVAALAAAAREAGLEL